MQDKDGKTIIDVRFLNEVAFRILGSFSAPGGLDLDLSETVYRPALLTSGRPALAS